MIGSIWFAMDQYRLYLFNTTSDSLRHVNRAGQYFTFRIPNCLAKDQYRFYWFNTIRLIMICLQGWTIIYFQDTRRMDVFVGSLLFLVALLQQSNGRITYTHQPLVGKLCRPFSSFGLQAREHHHCHWHCIRNSTCIGVNYDRNKNNCWLLSLPCAEILNRTKFILTLYGSPGYIRGFLQDL